MHNKYILEIKDIAKTFRGNGGSLDKRTTNALTNVNLKIEEGKILGLVGESGCGKTTLGKIIVNLVNPDKGVVFYKDKQITDLSIREFRPYRKSLQMIFQNPFSSLNPMMRVEKILEEPVKMNKNNENAKERIFSLIKQVNLNPVKLKQFPKHLSGGERRRVGLARILALDPEVIILDEPVAALDLSIKGQIIQLLTDLQSKKKLTYLWISHDLITIKHIAYRIAIMYHGTIVEIIKKEMLEKLIHPYSKKLFSASKFMSTQDTQFEEESELLSEYIYSGNGQACPYLRMCPLFRCNGYPEACQRIIPELKEIEEGHQIACHLNNRSCQ
jgi:ABC-type oligopeptide transport system ATPase subunit